MTVDNRAGLARLIQEELDTSRRGPAAIVAGWPLGRQRSFYDWRDGSVAPLRKSRPLLEEALGWRPGVVTEILEAPITREFTLSEVRDWAKQPEPGAVRARDLSTDDLLMELTRRVGALQEIVDRVKREEVTAVRDSQDMYDVAAHSTAAGRNMEHIEDERNTPG